MEGDRSDQPSIESDSLRMQTFSVYPPELNKTISISFLYAFVGGAGRERKKAKEINPPHALFSTSLFSAACARWEIHFYCQRHCPYILSNE